MRGSTILTCGVFLATTMLFATLVQTRERSTLTGSWRIDGTGNALPWTAVLRADGSKLTGIVSSCASPPVPIYDGGVDGDTFRFKCRSLDGDRVTTFRGTLRGDEITLQRETKVRDGGAAPAADNKVFGPAAPTTFTARRVPPEELDESDVFGIELAGAVNLRNRDVKVDGQLFLAQDVTRARAVITVIQWGLGFPLSYDPRVRRMLVTTRSALLSVAISNIGPSVQPVMPPAADAVSDALLQLLAQLARDAGHSELVTAPLLFWGHSAAANFGVLFAKAHPDRTAAIVAYHSGVINGDLGPLRDVPALFFVEGKAPPSNLTRAEESFRRSRPIGAAWTLVIEPDATHQDPKDLKNADLLLVPWVTSVLAQRVRSDAIGLRAIASGAGWAGNAKTGDVAPIGRMAGSGSETIWLPDAAAARGWQMVRTPAGSARTPAAIARWP